MDQRPSSDLSPNGRDLLQTLAICGLLLLAVGLVFGLTVGHDFINLDDDVCVYENPWITHGLTADGVRWAFTNRLVGNWDPVTWISHIADWQFYGKNAGGHHLTNVLLHAATVVLLFLVLRQMSGRPWPSALAAALFAIHPLRVESVAWVTERKDVLSGMFFMLTLLAYASYVQRRSLLARCLAYSAMLVCFALGLMSKPILVTLPCVLLLLDYWPLKRLGPPWRASVVALRVVEKLPLFGLSAGLCAVTVWAQRVALHEPAPPASRISDSLVSHAIYLAHFFCPMDLATPYPHRELAWPVWTVVGAALLLIGVTGAAWTLRRKCPYLLVGWLWYLGMMIPVIGLMPFGAEVTADRFTYLPQIGIAIAVVWGMADLCRSRVYLRWGWGIASVLALAALAWTAHRQTSYWRNSETLWAHTLRCTTNNFTAHRLYGNALAALGHISRAEEQYRAAVAIKPDYAAAYYNLGVAAASRGDMDEAMSQYRKVLKASPDHDCAHNNLGYGLLLRGESYEALKHFKEALRVKPDFTEAHYNCGLALHDLGHFRAAVAEYQEAIRTKPDYPEAYYNLGLAFDACGQRAEARYNNGRALHALGHLAEAMVDYRKAIEIKPEFAEAHYNLGLALDASGRREDAIIHYREALKIKPDFTEARLSLEAISAGRDP
jgi:tetratricopeptide (TPR) repeat protein